MALAQLLVKSQLGENLRRARRAADLTQEQVAAKLGVTKQTISDQERGEATPNEKNLQALATLYGTSEAELRYGRELGRRLHRGIVESTTGLAVFEQPGDGSYSRPIRVALGIPQRIRVWLQGFLLELTKAGVTEEEVDGIRRILSSDEMYRYYVGGEPKEYSEDETLEGIQAHAEAFRRDLRRRGYKLPK
jgi:transcriptional regulator with XRE-family HTH domain